MTARRAAPALLAVLGLALTACASGAADAPRTDDAPAPRSGDDLLRAGDFDAAVRAFERDGAAAGTPEAREKLLNAKTRAALAHADAAVRAADSGDYARARSELDRADMFGPDLPAVRDAHATIGARLDVGESAAALRAKARAVVATDPAEAERLLDEAHSLAPDEDDAAAAATARLRRDATLRAEAVRGAERAEAAWAAHDRDRTARELAAARFGGRSVAKADSLRLVIEEELLRSSSRSDETALRADLQFADDAELHATVVATLRERLVERLLASAADLRDTRRPATAALMELEAARLRPGVKTPALDRIREAATLTVLVAPFEDGTGGRVDGADLARALRERLVLDALGGGLPMRALDDSDAARAAHPDALRLTGRVLTTRQTQGRLGRESKRFTYQSGTTRRPNPEFEKAAAAVTAAVAAVRAAEKAENDATAALGAIRGSEFAHAEGSPHSGDAVYQAKVAAAQAAVDRAAGAVKDARAAETAARQQAATLTRDIEEPVLAEQTIVVTTSAKTVQITAHVELTSGATTLLSQDVTAAAQHKETVSDGYAPGGIPADPDETPDDAAMAAQAADRFAAMAAGRVRAAAEGAAHKHLTAARDALRGGGRDEAAESFAMYLLATPDAASPDRAEAARALADLLGVHVALQTTPRKEEP